ncbi:MAG: hypothetical protein R3B45_16085 [Bdellovibrionota bacterium]
MRAPNLQINIPIAMQCLSSAFRYLFLAFICISLDNVKADEMPETFTPVRPLGMGGAFTAISNDESAVWTNPAGISRIRKARSRKGLHALSFPFIAGTNSEGRNAYTKFKAIKGSSDGDNAEVISEAAAALGNKPFWVRAAFNPLVVFELKKGSPATFGAFSDNKTQIIVDSESESADVKAIFDTGVNLGFGFSNRTNRLNFGFQVRPTYRYSYDDKIALATLIDKTAFSEEVTNNSNKGIGTAVDVGGMFTMADFWFPTFAFSVLNVPTGCQDNYLNPFDETRHTICGTKFGGTVKNPEALSTVDPTDVRVGLSITPRLSRDVGFRLALDAHNLYFNSGDTYYGLPGIEPSKQLHAGLELFFGNPLLINPTTFRVGYNQGFITFGASLRASFFSIEFASYGKDVSTTATRQEDRRSLLKFSFEL